MGTIILVTQLMGQRNKATGLTLAVSAKVLGMMVGAWMMGLIAERWGYQVMFACIAVSASATWIIGSRGSPLPRWYAENGSPVYSFLARIVGRTKRR